MPQKVLAIGAAAVPGSATSAQLRQEVRLPFTHVKSFDAAINNGGGSHTSSSSFPKILRIEGSGPIQIILFSTGVVSTSSSDASLHGHVIRFPFSRSSSLPEDETTTKIVDIAAGESHYVAVDSKGRVYTWGWSNEFGQLGHGSIFSPRDDLIGVHEPVYIGFGEGPPPPPPRGGSDEQERTSPTYNCGKAISTSIEKKVPHKIITVACGRHHSVLLTESKRCVYVFGRGHRGQLGLKDTTPTNVASSSSSSSSIVVDFVPTPRSVPTLFGLPIAQICCSSGAHHTLVVLESGHLIAMGENISGNLGVGVEETTSSTRRATGSTPSCASALRGSHSHCFVPTVVNIVDRKSNNNNSTKSTGNNNYGKKTTIEKDEDEMLNIQDIPTFPQLPRRITPLIPVDRKTNLPLQLPSVQVTFADSSSLHTILVDKNNRLLTAGAPPLRLQNGDQPVSALGCLGRKVESAADASTFEVVPEFFVDLQSSSSSSVESGDSAICGNGFTAVLLRRLNTVFVSGAVQAAPKKSDAAVGAGAEAARGWLELDLPKNVEVKQIFASGNGLLVVVKE